MSDLIKREDAIELVALCGTKPIAPWTFDELQEEIQNLPSAEPKQGEWIDKGWHGDWQFETDGRGNCWKAFECSNCNTISKVQTNFCPNCGARMKGADDE